MWFSATRPGNGRRTTAALCVTLLAALAARAWPATPASGGRGVRAAADGSRAAHQAAQDTTPSPTSPHAAAERIAEACGGSNPYVVTSRFEGDLSGAKAAREPAVFAFRDTPGDDPAEQIVLATQAQVGAVYGLAYDPTRRQLYAAAYHKRGAPFGPGGPGAIYRIDVDTGTATTWATLPAGPDRHQRPMGKDEIAATWVGRTGLADIDLDEDATTLFVMNLFDQRVYGLAVPDGAVLGSFPIGAAGTDWQRDARPFALAYHGGRLFHGVMEQGGATVDAPLAHVYGSLPDGGDLREVATVAMAGGSPVYAWGSHAVPVLADIEFRDNGEMIVGVRNRSLDASIGTLYHAPTGDVLVGAPAGGLWEFVTAPEHYDDTVTSVDEATSGPLAALPGIDRLVTSVLHLTGSPHGRPGGSAAGAGSGSTIGQHAQGPAQIPGYVAGGLAAVWFDNESGRQERSELLEVVGYPVDDELPVGGGDIEGLCDRAQPLDPERLATETRQAGDIATATRGAAATRILATHTMAAATEEARGTAAAATATAGARTGTPAGATPPGPGPAPTLTAVVAQLTADAPKRAALATAASTADNVPAATRAAAAAALDRIRGSCGGDNPYIAIACFVPAVGYGGRSDSPGSRDDAPIVKAFNDSQPESYAGHAQLAYEPQAGAVFGLAYDWRRGHLYASAYNKVLAAFGPAGPGAIYRIDLATGAVRPWAWLDAGPDRHDASDNADAGAAPYVGKDGLGDIELDDTASTLLAVNLYDRLIYRLSVPDGRIVGVFPHGAAGEAWAQSARPFGLGLRDGWLYHGVVDERDRRAKSDVGLRALVYRSRLDGSQMSEVVSFDMAYARSMPWQGWSDKTIVAGAMLTDIEFRPNGDPILALRNRGGDGLLGGAGVGDGDILPTIRVGERWFVWSQPEFYPDQIVHDESVWGGLAALPGADAVVASVLDPWQANSGGAIWYDNLSGDMSRRETVYDYQAGYPTFSKAAGLGDVEVLCPGVTPTPSPVPTLAPSLTPSVTPSRTATDTPTRVSTATATSRPKPIYLPVALSESCTKRQVYADVVLVIDVSTSMRRPAGDGRPKLDAVQAAARSFLDRMELAPAFGTPGDQIAIVGFNDRAWIEQGLTGNRTTLGTAIDHLRQGMAEGTRLDLAIDAGTQALSGPARRPVNSAVIVLLTDGMPNRVPTPAPSGSQEDSVLLAASAAKAHGIRIYAIGVGRGDATELADRINPDLLRGIASQPRMFFQTWSADELAAIYREIAYTIGCPAESFWGRR